jgi:dimeric dUTPase (all-alpha-NTP-PPase superfamily)
MEINLAPLLLKQRELDADINSRHNVTHESTKTERFLALLVEIGDRMNSKISITLHPEIKHHNAEYIH